MRRVVSPLCEGIIIRGLGNRLARPVDAAELTSLWADIIDMCNPCRPVLGARRTCPGGQAEIRGFALEPIAKRNSHIRDVDVERRIGDNASK